MSQATPPSRPPYPSQDPLLPFTNHHNWQGSSAQNLHKIPTRVLREPEGHQWAPLPDDLSHRPGGQKANVPSVLLVNPWHIHVHTVHMYFSGPWWGLSAWGQDYAGWLQSVGP